MTVFYIIDLFDFHSIHLPETAASAFHRYRQGGIGIRVNPGTHDNLSITEEDFDCGGVADDTNLAERSRDVGAADGTSVSEILEGILGFGLCGSCGSELHRTFFTGRGVADLKAVIQCDYGILV